MDSLSMRAKRWAASKMSETKAGRGTVIKMIGEEGDLIISAMFSAVNKFANEDTAEELQKSAIKLLLKGGLAWNEGHVNTDAAYAAVEPMVNLARMIIDMCTREGGTKDVRALGQALNAAHDICMPIIAPVMKEKNSALLTQLTNYFGNPQFLEQFLHAPDYAEERAAVGQSLATVLEIHRSTAVATQICSVRGCLLPRCDIDGTLYCTGHHALKYSEPPTLDDFLKNPTHCRLFQEYILEHHERNVLDAWMKMDQYRHIQNRNIRKERGQGIFDRFVKDGAPEHVDLKPETVAAIEAELDGAKTSLFFEAMEELLDILDDIFCGDFRTSPQYAEFAAANLGIEVPPMLGLRRVNAAEGGGGALGELWTAAASGAGNTGSVAYIQARYVKGASDLGTGTGRRRSASDAASAGAAGAAGGAGGAAGAPRASMPAGSFGAEESKSPK